MPILLFTDGEVANEMLRQARELSQEIHLLVDLEKKPLNPGESVADRHHKLAKLGKRLAVAFTMLDLVMGGESRDEAAEPDPAAGPAPADHQAN